MKIPFALPSINDKEIKAVESVLKSGWLAQGKKVQEFEEEFAEYVGAKYAVAVNSCTAALFLAIKSLDLKSNTAFEVPSITFTASAASIMHAGHRPKFIDVNKDTLIPDEYIRYNPTVRVHLTGVRLKQATNELTIQDSAHLVSPGQFKNNKGLACFSFYATKNMTTGEGGMIVTNDKKKADWLRLARSHGQTKDNYKRYVEGGANNWRYSIEFPGWKMNMNDMQAAIGIEQLKKLPELDNKRQSIVDRYNKAFKLERTGLHLYPIISENRDEFVRKMHQDGIGCSVHFLPLHKMPAYDKYSPAVGLRNSEWLGNRLVSLPLYPDMTDKEVDYVIEKTLKYNKWSNND